ncbi:conujugal transfer protein TraF [Bifidobacterium gallicum DSM 20093 = LMG 11596]|nr:conujugal transfer protein TraF [Bifidobacterium gallicum DSM 20093 = LMG 11596]
MWAIDGMSRCADAEDGVICPSRSALEEQLKSTWLAFGRGVEKRRTCVGAMLQPGLWSGL